VREVFAVIATLREAGTSILLVEQNARAALKIADHAYVMENGKIAIEGEAKAIAGNPLVVEKFLGISDSSSGKELIHD